MRKKEEKVKRKGKIKEIKKEIKDRKKTRGS